MVKRLFTFLLVLALLYMTRPFWADSVSPYIPLDWLDPIDEQVEKFAPKETFKKYSEWLDEHNGQRVDEENVAPRIEKNDPLYRQFAIASIEIGMSKQTVHEKHGAPIRTMDNDYGTKWHAYHTNYYNFFLVAYDEHDIVRALYTNNDLITSATGVHLYSLRPDIRRVLPVPLKEMVKGNTRFILPENAWVDVFELRRTYAYAFYDIHQNDHLTALLLVDREFEKRKDSLYGKPSKSLRNGYEESLFELTNAIRVREGVRPLALHEALVYTARKHSQDMARRHYFSHDSPEGVSPFDRMATDRIRYKRAGENLAYGQFSSIFAHEGLFNSWDHRVNLLLPQYTHLAVGVAFDEEGAPYFTENFVEK